MEFGKVNDTSKVNFSMGAEPIFTRKLLHKLPPCDKPKIYFGCTGWAMKEWLGQYYPAKTKPQDYLYHYTRQFSTIELNATHYKIPSKETIATWYEQSDANFKFAPKIPQTISHSSTLGIGDNALSLFCENIVGLKEKLGVSFMQLPPEFGPNKLHILENFLHRFPTDKVPLTIEVRHQDWFDNAQNFQAFLDLLLAHNVGTVITDVAGRRDVLHLGLTTPCATIRFVGNHLHRTDFDRVDAWIGLLLDWIKIGLQEVYFFSHQPENIFSPVICDYFVNELEQRSNLRFDKKIKKIDDGQMKLF